MTWQEDYRRLKAADYRAFNDAVEIANIVSFEVSRLHSEEARARLEKLASNVEAAIVRKMLRVIERQEAQQ